MHISIDQTSLTNYIVIQANTFFPDRNAIQKKDIVEYISMGLEKVEFCFSKINNKYYKKNGEVVFNHLNSDHYSALLYILSRLAFAGEPDTNICIKLYLLNKCLHGIDIFYEVELPDIFVFVHPLGSVLGRANYSDYLVVYQKCNIGSNKGVHPTIGEYVTLHPGSVILGNCNVGDNCKLAAGSLLLDRDLERDSVYIGNPKDYTINKSTEINSVWTG